LVKIGADGEEQRVDVVQIARPGDLGVVRNPPFSGYTGERKLPAFEAGF
jgi:hypothetical protein